MTDDVVVHEAQSRSGALPAWSLPAGRGRRHRAPRPSGRSGSHATGRGAARPARACSVCILDSGVEDGHPLVGELDGAVAVSVDEDDERDRRGRHGGRLVRPRNGVRGHRPLDRAGLRASTASACSARASRAAGPVLLAGLRWAVEQGFDVINMSLSTTKTQFAALLHELADKRVLPPQRCSSPRRTTCRSRATRGGSRR